RPRRPAGARGGRARGGEGRRPPAHGAGRRGGSGRARRGARLRRGRRPEAGGSERGMTDVRAWLAGRSPRPPEALPLPVEDGAGPLTDRLARAGAAALERALVGAGERRGAYELLAADALITYACESAAEASAGAEDAATDAASGPDPEPRLLRILDLLAGQGG